VSEFEEDEIAAGGEMNLAVREHKGKGVYKKRVLW